MEFYNNSITFSNLNSLKDDLLIDFFYEFVKDGGLVQSGGERAKNKFRETIEKDFAQFKEFILSPFGNKFELKKWFDQIDNFPNFGIGIATIYLNRVDLNRFAIMNNKTLKALNKLGYKISSSKNWKNYVLVKEYQSDLISEFPSLKNYYKTDSLNHFIIAELKGKELMTEYQQIQVLENNLEQNEIEQQIIESLKHLSKKQLLSKILENGKGTSGKITINGKSYKRHNYLMAHIKKYRDFKCQFCSTKIPKSSGGYYIEACHIKAKAEGGKDVLNNILVLCPNCHKLFDYNKRVKPNKKNGIYSVFLNGKKYSASLE